MIHPSPPRLPALLNYRPSSLVESVAARMFLSPIASLAYGPGVIALIPFPYLLGRCHLDWLPLVFAQLATTIFPISHSLEHTKFYLPFYPLSSIMLHQGATPSSIALPSLCPSSNKSIVHLLFLMQAEVPSNLHRSLVTTSTTNTLVLQYP